MNDTTNSVVVAFLFVLRCLIPLGILFGISYLLRRLELVIEYSDEEPEAATSETAASSTHAAEADHAKEDDSVEKGPVAQSLPTTKQNAGGKKKPVTSKKKKEA